MPITTAQVEGNIYDGPHQISTSNFNRVSGVYLGVNSNGKIVDVGETEDLSERIPNHERAVCWNNNGGYFLWFHREGNLLQRRLKEKQVRSKFNPACGIR